MLYRGDMTGRKVKGIPRRRRSGHVRYRALAAERPILESGWVRDPDTSTGIPLLGLSDTRTSRDGPRYWPPLNTSLMVKPGRTDEAEDRRWCRWDAYLAAYKRILGQYAHPSSHRAHMLLFRKTMEWVELGRPDGWTFNIWVNQVRTSGGNMVLVDRLLLYIQLDLDDDKFREACNKAPVSLVRAPS